MKLPTKKKSNSITFYVFHLPILILAAFALVVTSLVASKASDPNGFVLGDDEDNSGKNEEDDDDEDQEDEDENEDEEDEEDEDEDDDKFEVEDEDEDSTKSKTTEKVQNSDGTYSIIKTEIEDDKTKVEVKTYGSNGKLVGEEKTESSDEGIESETEDADGNKTKIRIEDEKVLIKQEGVTGLNNFPLFLNEENGMVYVQTPKGEVQLGVMPDVIVNKASESNSVVKEIEVEAENSIQENKLEFKVKTTKPEKLFGLFQLELPSTEYYDTQTGEYLRSEKPILTKILDFLSY